MSFQDFLPNTTQYHPENALSLGRSSKLAYEAPALIESRCKEWGLDPMALP